MIITGEKIKWFQSLYADAKNRLADHIALMSRNMAQYKGDKKIDGSNEEADFVRNITYELVEAKVSNEIPMPKVTPASYNEARSRNARSIERFLIRERDRLPFESLNDMDERYTYIYGGSVWLVQWDDTEGNSAEHGALTISLIPPQDFFGQPGIYEIEDMDYLFVRYNTTRDAIREQYGVDLAPTDGSLDLDLQIDPNDEETITLVVCYYRKDGGVCKFTWTGGKTVEDIEDYYTRRNRKCRICHRWDTQCECEEPDFEEVDLNFETITTPIERPDGSVIKPFMPKYNEDGTVATRKETRIMTDDNGLPVPNPEADGLPMTEEVQVEEMIPTELPYYHPTLFPVVVRKNTSAEKNLFGRSDCDTIRMQQQAVNKIETRMQQKLVRASVMPILPEDAEIQTTNDVFGKIIRLKPGEDKSRYGVVDTTPRIDSDVAEAERLYQQAKMIVGITDSYQGVSEYAGQSGKAMQTLAQQSAGRIESTRRMKRFAYSQLDRIAFQFALAYSDEPRMLRYTDAFGTEQNTQFSRYDFLEWNDTTHKWEYYDGYTFATDASSAMEQDRAAMWEANLNNLQAGTFGNPADPTTLLRYWKMQERDHYPNASEQVNYFQQLLTQMRTAQEAQMQVAPSVGAQPTAGAMSPAPETVD